MTEKCGDAEWISTEIFRFSLVEVSLVLPHDIQSRQTVMYRRG